MAVYSNDRSQGRASFGARDSFNANLPSGSCNYRDLSTGAKAPTCGCRRFWLDSTKVVVVGTDKAWCFCGHHACFHNAFSQNHQRQASLPVVAEAGQRPSSPPHFSRELQTDNDFTPQREATPMKTTTGLGIRPDSSQQSQSINTRLWDALNGFARQQEDGNMSDTTSKLPSTAVPSLVEAEQNLSPNHLLAEKLRFCQPMAPPVHIPTGFATRPGAEDYQGSATEVATPSMAGTPDLRAFAPPGTQARVSSAQRKVAPTEEHVSPSPAAPSHPALVASPQPSSRPAAASSAADQALSTTINADVQQLLRSYGHRLQVLETLSFTQVPLEEIQDRFDLVDGRLLDLEHWRSDQDRLLTFGEAAQASSSKRRRTSPTEGSSSGSELSFDEQAAMHTEAAVLATLAANAETGPRIDALENRIVDLENAAMPSYNRPWQVEVVLLPWSRDLRGIWFSSADATQQSQRSLVSGIPEWTGTDRVVKSSFTSSVSGAWTTESIQAWAEEAQDWLSPKACGPNGSVYQRLASRGLVKEVTIAAPDPRHILDAIRDAFKSVASSQDNKTATVSQDYQCLEEHFIPLRKVRKSSRLRFLNPSEMITSATWTASFLDSSVMMKVYDQQRRLYITTPEAYHQKDAGQWSWQMIKRLPPCDAEGEPLLAQRDPTGAIEACWTYNERLDCPPSLHTSFATQASNRSSKSAGSQHSEEDVGAAEFAVPTLAPPERGQRYHLRKRTVSLPLSSSSSHEVTKPETSKRRVASFETVQTAPMSAEASNALTSSKRRRLSASPEVERKGVYFTPRWSREPPSPFTSDAAGMARSQGTASSSRRRGNTPFAYATPHSNSNMVGTIDLMDGEETVPDSDMDKNEHSEQNDDEWNGVDEDAMDLNSDAGSAHEDGEDEEDEA